MRPYMSVSVSLPLVPTTTAVCGPAITGLGVMRGDRKAAPVELMARKSQR